jgi:hypothetical protein
MLVVYVDNVTKYYVVFHVVHFAFIYNLGHILCKRLTVMASFGVMYSSHGQLMYSVTSNGCRMD